MKLTDDYIDREYDRWWSEHPEETPSFETVSLISEKLRALYALQASEGTMRPEAVMSLYMVRQDVAAEILANYCKVTPSAVQQKPQKRADKYSAIYEWASENVGQTVTPREISEIGGISYPTALKLVAKRPDLFNRVGHGSYKVRNPEEDRKETQ